MVEMSLKELFEIGQSFESSVGEGTKGERARIFKNNSRLNLTDEMISFIENIDYEVNFLVSGEIWCPDFQLNISVIHILLKSIRFLRHLQIPDDVRNEYADFYI